MSTFAAKFRIWNPANPEKVEAIELGAYSLEGLGVAADPIQKRLTPTIMSAVSAAVVPRRGRIIRAIDGAASEAGP